MSEFLGYLWAIRWHNPYTEPPDGQPYTRAEIFMLTSDPSCRRAPVELLALAEPGNGYSVYGQAIMGPAQAYSAEQLAKVRKARLEHRAQQRYPLFADQVVAEAIERKPDYYAGGSDHDAKRVEVLQYEAGRREYLLANAGKLLVYGD